VKTNIQSDYFFRISIRSLLPTGLRQRVKRAGKMISAQAKILCCLLLILAQRDARAGATFEKKPLLLGSGANPVSTLLSVNGVLYGTTQDDGDGYGTVFKENPNGTGYTVIHTFGAKMMDRGNGLTGPDGQNPKAGLIADPKGQWLYGTTAEGGEYGDGTVFAIEVTDNGRDMDSHGDPTYLILVSLDGTFGTQPSGRLTSSSDGTALYGTTRAGRSAVYEVDIINQGTATTPPFPDLSANATNLMSSQGYMLSGDLVLTNGWLYGTAAAGGVNGYGSVFTVSVPVGPTGKCLPIWNFTGSMNSAGPNNTLIPDSANPVGGLLLFGSTLYGTTAGNSTFGSPAGPDYGTVFALNIRGLNPDSSGTPFANGRMLWSFPLPPGQNAPGEAGEASVGDLAVMAPPQPPYAGTLLAMLSGSSTSGDPVGPAGGVLEIDTESSTSPNAPSAPTYFPLDASGDQGMSPQAGLIAGPSPFPFHFRSPFPSVNEYFYGTATYGGNGYGTIFYVDMWGFEAFGEMNGKFTVSWVDPPAVKLQSATSPNGPWTNVAAPYTNNGTAPAQFFRLAFNLTNFPVLMPAVTTLPAGGISLSSATLNGFVVPNRTNATAWFKWGTTTNYGNLTSSTFVSMTNALTVSSSISGLTAGTTYHYQVVASNSAGTAAGADAIFTTPDSSSCVTPPAGLVNWWPANSNADDIIGGDNGILEGGVTYSDGEVGEAFSFDGTSGYVATSLVVTNPQTFSLTLWFQTTTTNGGVLISFDNTQTAQSGDEYDRNIYMDNTGALHFGVWNSGAQQVNSGSGYNDGNWHYVVGSLSAATGVSLYIDGALVGHNSGVTNAQEVYDGYWRIGEDNLANWPPQYQPNSQYFQGQIDEVAIFGTALAATNVTAIYDAGTNGMCQP